MPLTISENKHQSSQHNIEYMRAIKMAATAHIAPTAR